MNYKKLNETIDGFISDDNNKVYIENLKYVLPLCKYVLNEPLPEVVNSNYSKNFELNETIAVVSNFLNEIDENLANQFNNIITSVNEKNEPYVRFYAKKTNPRFTDEVNRDGIVYIGINNSPDDMFILLHEMLHKMNHQGINYDSITRDYYGEAVSIAGEMLLGKYLVEQGIITANDFKLWRRNRIISTRENARDIIIESVLLQMKLNDIEINEKTLLTLPELEKNTILQDEAHDLRRISSIINNEKMSFPKSQRYVIALSVSRELMNKENQKEKFLKLHYVVGDINSNLVEVTKSIKGR